MQQHKAPAAEPTFSEPDRFRSSPDSPKAKEDFDQLLKKIETDKSASSDPDWAKFQAFLGKQAQKFPPNDSGKGVESILPAELRGLNWGACTMNIIWGAAMKVTGGTLFAWTVLMMIIPILPFYLLWKGNEIAWRSKKWETSADFIEAQNKWTTIGWIVLVVCVVAIVGLVGFIMHMVGPLFKGTPFDPFGAGGKMFGM